jgi:two-component system sensor histidine kinase KdpD
MLLQWLDVNNATTVALSFLLIVLSAATTSSLWVAVASSVAAIATLNFFFMAPVGTFMLADGENWVALTVFLTVGCVASRQSESVRVRAKEAAERRNDAELMRQKADLASTLLTSLSHDLRTPLTAIGVAVENLQQARLSDDERREQGRVALVELERLKRLFSDILDMARIDAAALAIERDWVTPADIVDAALSNLRPTLDQRAMEIDADSSNLVLVDPRLTSGALSHLIENAAQYSPAGSVIHVRGTIERDGLRVTVRDHGHGLDPAELDQLFERFFRGRTAEQHRLGTGMGLAITRGLLAAEHGRVWGENAAGGGAQFTIAVPGESHPVPHEETI